MKYINSEGKKIILTILSFVVSAFLIVLIYDIIFLKTDYTKGWSTTTYTNTELGGNDINLNRAKYYLSEHDSNIRMKIIDTYSIEDGKEIIEGDISSYYGKIIDLEGYITNISDYDYDSKYNFDKKFENRLSYVTIVLIDNTYVHSLLIEKRKIFDQDRPFGLGDHIKIRGFIIGKLKFVDEKDGIDFVGLMD